MARMRMAGVEQVRNQEPGASSCFPTWVQRFKTLSQFLLPFYTIIRAMHPKWSCQDSNQCPSWCHRLRFWLLPHCANPVQIFHHDHLSWTLWRFLTEQPDSQHLCLGSFSFRLFHSFPKMTLWQFKMRLQIAFHFGHLPLPSTGINCKPILWSSPYTLNLSGCVPKSLTSNIHHALFSQPQGKETAIWNTGDISQSDDQQEGASELRICKPWEVFVLVVGLSASTVLLCCFFLAFVFGNSCNGDVDG